MLESQICDYDPTTSLSNKLQFTLYITIQFCKTSAKLTNYVQKSSN